METLDWRGRNWRSLPIFLRLRFLSLQHRWFPGSDLVLENVGINPTRTGLLSALCAMGALVTLENERSVGAEPVADLRVRCNDDGLSGIEVDGGPGAVHD